MGYHDTDQASRERLRDFIFKFADDHNVMVRQLWEARATDSATTLAWNIGGHIVLSQWYDNGLGWDIYLPVKHNSIDLTERALAAAVVETTEA